MCVHFRLYCTCWSLSFVCFVAFKVTAEQWLTPDLMVLALLSHVFYGFCWMLVVTPIAYRIGFNDGTGQHLARVADEITTDIHWMRENLAANNDSESDDDDDESDSHEDSDVSTGFG